MSKQEKYTEIKERLLKKEAMQTLFDWVHVIDERNFRVFANRN